MTDTKPQVNTRALPSEMILLLLLLSVTVLLNTLFIANWLSGLERGGTLNFLQKLQMLVTPGLAVYGTYVAVRIRRSTPLVKTSLREASKAITDLVLEVNPPRRTDIRLGKHLGSRAYVTGPPRKPIIVLGPELLALHAMPGERKAVFDAVVRHELAHVHAGDLWWYQLATVLRMSNLFTGFFAMFPLVLEVLLDRGDVASFAVSTARLVALTLLIELIARAFLRAREHAADLHAAEFGVEGLLAAVQAHETELTRSAVRTWLRRHPGADERSQALTNPMRLLASPIGQVFLGAVAAGTGFVTLQDLLLSGRTADKATPVITGVAIGIPLTLFAAFGLWRGAWQEERNRLRPLITASALLGGLVIGSHLPLYTRIFDQAPIGIPISPSVLPAIALGTLGLCWWLDALGTEWRHTEEAKALPICQSSTPQFDIARKVGADSGFTFWSILAVLVVATTLVVPHFLRTRTLRPAALIAVAVLVVVAALWTTRSPATQTNRARAEFRLVLDTSPALVTNSRTADRQSTDRSVQAAALEAHDCAQPDPLRGKANPAFPLVTCAHDGTEKYVLAPTSLSTVDIADAEVTETTSGYAITLGFTGEGAKRWQELTRANVNHRLAFLVDDDVLAVPNILQPLTGSSVPMAVPFKTEEDAEEVAAAIRGD